MSHRGFSFDKLKSKVTGRRSSESSIFEIGKSKSNERRNSVSNPMIIIEESDHEKGRLGRGSVGRGRIGSQSISVVSGSQADRTRSISNGRAVSKKQTKELIKHETAQVILKKLILVLQELGLQQPIPLNTTNNSQNGPTSKSAKVYVANTHDCIYLAPASSASFTYEDVENGGVPQDHGNDILNLNLNHDRDVETPTDGISNALHPLISLDSQDDDNYTEGMEPPPKLRQKMESFNSPNYLCTKIDSESPIPHTFAVIVELKKETLIRDVHFEFQSMTNILWPTGDPYNKTFIKEKFKIGYMEWLAKMSDAFFYINTSNSNDVKIKEVTPEKLASITRDYKLINVRDLANGVDKYNGKTISRKSSVQLDREDVENGVNAATSGTSESYKEGIYVFLLPVLLPEHIPPTITTVNGSLSHVLSVNINKISARLNRKVKVNAYYNLPMVRTPPLHANSIADKPIYVDRVWNDALHYIITFPKKYISLGSEHLINVKLIPLVKDVIIKRIKFNISERITYVSKNLSKEYDYDGDDPFHVNTLANSDKVRERLIPLCELKTKNKPSSSTFEPYKEEFIKCPDNNLLFSCYEQQLSTDDIDNLNLDDPLAKPLKNDSKDMLIASPLAINVALPFLTTRKDKTIVTSSISEDDVPSRRGSESISRKTSVAAADPTASPLSPSSPIIGALETNMTHNNELDALMRDEHNEIIRPDTSAFMSEQSHNFLKENIQRGYTMVSKALYPDSNFRHIQVYHRLQVCFRISKPDPKDNYKMHHYEVVVDTPLVLLSAKCNDDSIQLPKYDEIHLPLNQPQAPQVHGPAIPFRTPNYDRNGVSIKPLNQDGEVLPSFEEAVSAPTSPITRSVSLGEDQISRIPSIIPDEPAPAYEQEAPSRNDQNIFNIDSIVDAGTDSTSTNMRRSTIRSSLVNSFAHSGSGNDLGNNNLSTDVISSGMIDHLRHDSETNQVSSVDNISTTPTSSSNATNSSSCTGISAVSDESIMCATDMENQVVPETSGTEASQTEPSNPYHIGTDPSLQHNVDSSDKQNLCKDGPKEMEPVHPHIDKLNNVGVSNDQVSILTNLNFDQRLPLLENSSVDEINSNLRHTITNTSEVSNNIPSISDKQKRSTENLAMVMEMNQAQDIFRAV